MLDKLNLGYVRKVLVSSIYFLLFSWLVHVMTDLFSLYQVSSG
jgi:hypothetical protein